MGLVAYNHPIGKDCKWYLSGKKLPIGRLYLTYHLLGEPETAIDHGWFCMVLLWTYHDVQIGWGRKLTKSLPSGMQKILEHVQLVVRIRKSLLTCSQALHMAYITLTLMIYFLHINLDSFYMCTIPQKTSSANGAYHIQYIYIYIFTPYLQITFKQKIQMHIIRTFNQVLLGFNPSLLVGWSDPWTLLGVETTFTPSQHNIARWLEK